MFAKHSRVVFLYNLVYMFGRVGPLVTMATTMHKKATLKWIGCQHKEGKMHWANSPIHGNKVTKQPTDRDHYLCAHHNTL